MFIPFSSRSELASFPRRLLETRIRQMEMLLTRLSFTAPGTLPRTGYLDEMERLLTRQNDPAGQRTLRSTYLGMWLETLGRWSQDTGGETILPPPLDGAALDALARKTTLREEDVPPFMRLLIPPSHTFRRAYAPSGTRQPGAQSWEQALSTAIANADRIWPGLAEVIAAYTSHFLILEEIDFRSCSADRYLGLILLSTNDQSLIDIEESVIHETGHQILYQLDREKPLFHTHDDERDVELPWSGSHRNFFGFFHAAYIYLILRDYYARAAQSHPFDQAYCRQRLGEIQSGLDAAVALLCDGRPLLTAHGQEVSDAMIRHIGQPVPEHRPVCAEFA